MIGKLHLGAIAHATASLPQGECRDHMSQENVLDDEDQMSKALAEIRNDRVEEPVDVIEAPVPEAAAPEAVQEVVTQEPAPVAAPAAPTDTDQLKQAREELHRLQSDIGRVNALNSKYMQASREAAELREQIAQMQQAPAQVASAEVTIDKLAAVAEQVKDFPELAGIVAAVSDALKQSDRKTEEVARRIAAQVVEPLEPLRREQTTRIENEQRASYDAALATFNSTYPTAVDVVQSDDFKSWLGNQPGNVQYAFAKGKTPQEAMTVLDTYDMHLRRSGQPPIAHFNQTQPDVQSAPARTAPNVNRLQRAAGIPSRQSGSQGGQPPSDDFDASLAYFRSKRLSAQRATA